MPEVERKSLAVRAPFICPMVEEVDLKLLIVVSPFKTEMVEETERKDDDASPVIWTEPLIREIVADVDLNPLLVNSLDTVVGPVILAMVTAPFINEMVAEVDRNPLFVSSPETVTLPLSVGMVAEGAFNPPLTSIYPKTVLF